jgi:SAM-dependent methyltransferase
MDTNNWSEKEANRALERWGHKTPPYTVDAFEFIINGISSWLDLGCGFGRFFDYLEYHSTEPDYIGYDSSQAMLNIFKERFPVYAPRVFHRDITAPINNKQHGILCNAVLIHLKLKEQNKILKNVFDTKPKKFVFDINSPTESWLKKGQENFIRMFKGCEGAFIMNWQSHYKMTERILDLFKGYDLFIKFYDLKANRHKVVYFLERRA